MGVGGLVTHRHGISAAERDAIVSALKHRPDAIAEIASEFMRSQTTIERIKGANRL